MKKRHRLVSQNIFVVDWNFKMKQRKLGKRTQTQFELPGGHLDASHQALRNTVQVQRSSVEARDKDLGAICIWAVAKIMRFVKSPRKREHWVTPVTKKKGGN